MADSVETAVNLSNGLSVVEYENETLPKKFRKLESVTFSSKFSCPESGFTIEEIEPRLFSFNSPIGACVTCSGLGMINEPDINIIMPDQNLSLNGGAVQINGFGNSDTYYFQQTIIIKS